MYKPPHDRSVFGLAGQPSPVTIILFTSSARTRKSQGRNGFRLALPRKLVELGETTIIGFGGRPRATSVAIYDSILHILGQDH
jgi:hypothetical protein